MIKRIHQNFDFSLLLLLGTRAQAPVSGLLGRLVPRARIVPAVRPEDMSPEPDVVKAYIEDPLNTVGNVPVRTGMGTGALPQCYQHQALLLAADACA